MRELSRWPKKVSMCTKILFINCIEMKRLENKINWWSADGCENYSFRLCRKKEMRKSTMSLTHIVFDVRKNYNHLGHKNEKSRKKNKLMTHKIVDVHWNYLLSFFFRRNKEMRMRIKPLTHKGVHVYDNYFHLLQRNEVRKLWLNKLVTHKFADVYENYLSMFFCMFVVVFFFHRNKEIRKRNRLWTPKGAVVYNYNHCRHRKKA